MHGVRLIVNLMTSETIANFKIAYNFNNLIENKNWHQFCIHKTMSGLTFSFVSGKRLLSDAPGVDPTPGATF